MTKRVLYIHHSGIFGGASRSLGELVASIPKGEIEPIIVSQVGGAADYFENFGFRVYRVKGLSKFDITELGYYKGLRWLILLRELAFLPSSIAVLRKVRQDYPSVDLVHINDVQDFLLAYLIKLFWKAPIILHVRGPLMKRHGFRYRWVMKFIKTKIDHIIAIDKTVSDSIDSTVNHEIVHNGLIVKHNEVTPKHSDVLTIGMVSNLLRFKGVLDFIETARIAKSQQLSIRFIILGGKEHVNNGIIGKILKVFGFKHDVADEIYDRIKKYELDQIFEVRPFSHNIGEFFSEISVLCFPSHINAVGRPVFEAGFYSVPSIVAISHPQADAIVPFETGMCIQEKDPDSLFTAILHFYNTRSEVKRMGENALKLVNENYNIYRNAERVLEVYNQVMQKFIVND